MATSRLLKSFLALSTTGAGLYAYDTNTEAQLITRNIRTFSNGVGLALDYKLNFKPGDMSSMDAVHERVANRIFDVCELNGGLFIKIGQVIGTQASVLPAQYQKRARRLFDSAPAVPYSVVERVFLEDFGVKPEQLFKEFDKNPVASASIAQVHKAVLHDDTIVAVKVQKPAIQKQMTSDLRAFRWLLMLYERIFDLPMVWTFDYFEKHIRMEADFEREAQNSIKAWENLQKESSLRDRVYVPKVYSEIGSKRIMVAEWVDGVQLTALDDLKEIGASPTEAMQITIEAFASQIFKSGFVHGDPHPGNVLVRKHPKKKNEIQVVLIDHGLYIEESERFRQQYCKLWEAMFLLDVKALDEICKQWGVNDSNMFASVTLQKPYMPSKAPHLSNNQVSFQDAYEMQMSMKSRIKHFLADQQLFPRELIFVSRNMNIVRANNKSMGSPVNRINVMARWAVHGMDRKDEAKGVRGYLRSTWRVILFESTLFAMTLSFYIVKFRDVANKLFWGTTNQGGFEGLLDERMKEQLQQQFGIVLDESVFDA
ncbi:ABC1 family-domain-containing protein [Umbelopsis sp. AD052]|nr:ABC1 family-domain-containing protein [Umbelopsis sp. AD052]